MTNVCVLKHYTRAMQGFVIVTITVLDINDSPPAFSSSLYTAEVLENLPTGTTLEVVSQCRMIVIIIILFMYFMAYLWVTCFCVIGTSHYCR